MDSVVLIGSCDKTIPAQMMAAAAPERGYAALFHRCVLQADEGCDFDFLVPGRGLAGQAVP